MSEQYLGRDFLAGLVVWQKSPKDDPIIVDGEEGIPYFSPNGRPKLAILKNGQLIDAISIDIITKKVTSYDDIRHQNNQHGFRYWGNKTLGLWVNETVVIRAMRNRAKLRQIGWNDERLQVELSVLLISMTYSKTSDQFLATVSRRNWMSNQRDDISILAIGAYGLYQGFSPRKGFKAPMKGKNEGEIADTVMRLALYIALINPCMGIPWGKEHTLQGKRGQRRPKSDLEVLLDSLMDRYAQLPVEIEGDDLVEELYGDEVASLKVTIGAVYRDIQLEESERMIQPDAVKAAKAKLMTIGIECKTNVEGQEWAQFVAAAWGVTPSQVVSAAKKIEK